MVRRENETKDQYFYRLCENKEITGLTWPNITDLMNKETGENYTESKYRKDWKLFKKGMVEGYKRAIDSDAVLKEYELSLQKMAEEKVKLRDNRTALSAQIRSKARFENVIEELKTEMKKELPPLNFSSVKAQSEGNDIMVISLSDLHYGAEFKNFWGEYSPEVFRQRMEKYLSRVLEIASKNNIKKIKVLSLGDAISGIIHVSTRLQNSENVIKQVQNVSEYISQFLYGLSSWFEEVEFYSAIGNHGRVSPSKEDHIYDENLEKLIPWYIEAKLSGVTNVTVKKNDIDAGICVVNLFDYFIFGVHGDCDSFDKASITLPAMLRKFPASIWTGHLHNFGVVTKNDIETIKSGSMCGSDEYAKGKRLVGNPCQTVAIYNEEGLDCLYNIKL